MRISLSNWSIPLCGVGFAVAVSSVAVNLYTIRSRVHIGVEATRSRTTKSYSYVEMDFPETLVDPAQHKYDASLTIEDSVHYFPNASSEWASLFPPGSGGFVRLGPSHRLFGVSMFHQLHCLDKMRRAVMSEPPTEWERWHTQHCLNYVRQMLLCASSIRIEPVKIVERHGRQEFKVDGLGMEHKCRDWGALRREVERNYEQWPDDVHL